ncbi:MAG TPA: hypothetical protein VFY91_18475 [Microbacterium sp.]|nr:hypothetical protein [Microbacterium sp.]
MTDEVPTRYEDRSMGQVITLLQVIAGLLVVIAIVLLLIFVRGPETQDRSGAPAFVAAITASS